MTCSVRLRLSVPRRLSVQLRVSLVHHLLRLPTFPRYMFLGLYLSINVSLLELVMATYFYHYFKHLCVLALHDDVLISSSYIYLSGISATFCASLSVVRVMDLLIDIHS